jgi:hypothetical protein
VSDLFLKFMFYLFQGKLPRLESFPDCGRVGNPHHVECIWDCDWVDNPKFKQQPNTGIGLIDLMIQDSVLTYNLIKYPPDIACLEDCELITKLREANILELSGIVTQVLRGRGRKSVNDCKACQREGIE